MMKDPGERPHLVIFQRQGPETDDGYTKRPGAWAEYARGWAKIRYGTGAERREAAQEQASQVATFEFDYAPKLAALAITDRAVFGGGDWDISGAIVVGLNEEVHVTAVRAR